MSIFGSALMLALARKTPSAMKKVYRYFNKRNKAQQLAQAKENQLKLNAAKANYKKAKGYDKAALGLGLKKLNVSAKGDPSSLNSLPIALKQPLPTKGKQSNVAQKYFGANKNKVAPIAQEQVTNPYATMRTVGKGERGLKEGQQTFKPIPKPRKKPSTSVGVVNAPNSNEKSEILATQFGL